MPRPVRFALLGYGRVAPTHVDAIEALGTRAELVAICDADPEALALGVSRTGADPAPTLEALLQRADIDVVAICTPSGTHAQQGIAAARAGKHVLVEKPMDVDPAAARALLDACTEAGVRLFPVFQNRLNTTVRLLKAAQNAGRFGKILALNSTVVWHRGQDYYDSAPWRGTRTMDGGAFMNQGIHFVDVMRHIAGNVRNVQSMLGTLSRNMECEDTGAALLRFESGAIGNVFVTMAGCRDLEGSLTVLGENGLVKIGGNALNTIEAWTFETPHPEQDALAANAGYHTASVYGNGHKLCYEQVVTALTDPQTPAPIDPEDALRSVQLIHEIYRTNCG